MTDNLEERLRARLAAEQFKSGGGGSTAIREGHNIPIYVDVAIAAMREAYSLDRPSQPIAGGVTEEYTRNKGLAAAARAVSRNPNAKINDLRGALKGLLNLYDALEAAIRALAKQEDK